MEPERFIAAHSLSQFATFYGTRTFHCSPQLVTILTQINPKSIHLHVDLPSSFFSSGFPAKNKKP
jgi:hypothetical protein